MDQAQKAAELHRLHTSDRILVVHNAWDVGSARIFAASGAAVVGTTRMGVAAAAGYPDEEVFGLELMLDAVGAIAGAVDVPVTADMERGYGATAAEAARSIGLALERGIAGVNIEDGTGVTAAPLCDSAELVERLAAIRAMGDERGIHLVINARTDAVLAGNPGDSGRIGEALRRGNEYLAAGADCVFVPGGLTVEDIRTLVAGLDGPLNVVANPALSRPVVPTIPELQELGVARVSIGSGALRSVLALTRRIARELNDAGTYHAMIAELEAEGAAEAYAMAIGRGTP